MLPDPHGGKLIRIGEIDSNGLDINDVKDGIPVSYETAVTIADLSHGILSPMDGFPVRSDYESILQSQRLENGTPWSIPIMLTVSREKARSLREGSRVILTSESRSIAELEIREMYEYSRREHAMKVFGTESSEHPGVIKLQEAGDIAIGGKLISAGTVDLPFRGTTMFPADTRKLFKDRGWETVSAFQTRNVPHRGHEHIQRLSLKTTDGLFINPVIGKKKAGDYTDEAIMEAYRTLIENYYPAGSVILSPLHYEMMYAGPREAVMHAIMRKNYGCTHFIVGRDHAGVGSFYGPYEAQENLRKFDDLGITIIPYEETFYCRKCAQLVTEKECQHPASLQQRFSGTGIRKMINSDRLPPSEIMRSEVYSVIKSIRNPFVQ